MNAITEVPATVSAETLEHVLGTGDLSKLSVPQRVEYYRKTCESLGLNPLTRPIRFLTLNGQMQLYFTRDGTDQLRKVNGITLHVVDRASEAGVYSVTVRARDKHGREDEDIGAVVLPQGGESRANALMKAITKAKRRVTLSICGLGLTDESELDTMPGARVFDAEDEPPVAPIRTVVSTPGTRQAINDEVLMPPLRAAAAPTPRADRVVDPTVYDTPKPQKLSWSQWGDSLEVTARETPDDALGRVLARAEVGEIKRLAEQGAYSPAKARILDAIREMEERYNAHVRPPDADAGTDVDSAAEPAHA